MDGWTDEWMELEYSRAGFAILSTAYLSEEQTNINEMSAAPVVMLFVSSEIFKT